MQAYSTEAIRNVALVSHNGSGKTSLAEAMLFATGAVTRMGQIADGNTASDYEPEEIDRRSSVQTAIVPCEWKGKKVNVLDTPGYADFIGEVLSALEAADLAVVVVSAVDGVQVGTETAWREATKRGLPRMIVINKLDRENTNFLEALQAVQARLGKMCVAVAVPRAPVAQGTVSLLDADAAKDPQLAGVREKMVEAAAEADDALTEKYLNDGSLAPEDLVKGLKAGILKGTLVPVLPAAATQQVGVKELLDFLCAYGPSPVDRPASPAKNAAGQPLALKPDKTSPLAVRVFKTTADPYVGKLSYLRIVGGAPLNSDSHVWNANRNEGERVGQIFVPRGKAQEAVLSLAPGDIGAVAKLLHTHTGDTLCMREKPVTLPPIQFPRPVYGLALAPKTKTDMDKMGSALSRLVEEDPSLRMTRDPETGETVLSGLGEAHLDVACKKLKRKFGVDLLVSTPAIPYRETISMRTSAEYKHKKQAGGHGQYGHVFIDMEPLARGKGVEFATRVVGGSVPKEYVASVEKGVMESVQSGILAGRPVVDVKVTLTDGSSHPVDSSGMAFQIAAVQAVKKGIQQARPVLLEPVVHLKVTAPDSFTGDIMGDLNSKRARVSGATPQDGYTVIEAQAPLAEIQRYATDLRSLTQGRGSYSMEFSHYEEVPTHLSQKIIDAAAKKQG